MRKLIQLLTIALLLASCGHIQVKKTIDPKTVAFEAVYNENFDNVLYPSMMLALANYRGD